MEYRLSSRVRLRNLNKAIAERQAASCKPQVTDVGKQYRNLLAWQKADDLVMKIYDTTRQFPKEEVFRSEAAKILRGLTNKLEACSLQLEAN
jgi:hypothetical protein